VREKEATGLFFRTPTEFQARSAYNERTYMLNKDNRLTKVRDFNLILKHGRWANGSFLDLKYVELAKNTNYFPKKEDVDKFKKQLRLAITVGLKVSKSAVKRNKVKRQIREALRLLIKDSQLKSGVYLLFVARKNILEKNYAEISEEIKLLLKRSNIWMTRMA
jgi:ribonuclease P protein component